MGANKWPKRFVDVAVNVNERGAVEAGEIAVYAAQVFKENLVLQGAGDAIGVPCLVTDYQVIHRLFDLCMVHRIILFLVFVLLRIEVLFRSELGNA